ncbi:ABC transporter ATP-binding protein [Tuberibacillus sp. Marseille-P3662]|uniref:ABC transporter ATP-binding protein n=1 Tax=Tuberibacillus sp. Marseille-P3662 TaxID=1965358 RepID=UPI000A1CB832|nr:ABC transporter ATP-binding protein [Tuberibacillus sp. Marseille-P3662]
MFQLTNVKFKDIIAIPSLAINEGQITSIVGESGGGKTTLLKLLNHLITADEGKMTYNGERIDELDPIQLRREVIMLQQMPVMFDGDIKHNLTIGLTFSDAEDHVTEEEMKEMLDMFHLQKNLHDNAADLSGGEQQRVALARVLLMNAEVYLLDEPTSALDDHTEESIMQRFIDFIKKKNKTVIMVTHSKSMAETYSDNVIRIDDINKVVTSHGE